MVENARRRRLDLAWAALTLAAALAGLSRNWREDRPPPAPTLSPGPAAYRPDGGQNLTPAGRQTPNALTRLNLGRRIELTAAPARLLMALPGLGSQKTAERARADGCLTRRQRANLGGLVHETCGRTNP
ncbi:hypothetical protein FACS189460_2570 [Deltaproteobacteria bacterium]|nr:hypothetical protein FACS189460_2570 [Deltaproteobacteria bacterium]